jgi:hypothetical protein
MTAIPMSRGRRALLGAVSASVVLSAILTGCADGQQSVEEACAVISDSKLDQGIIDTLAASENAGDSPDEKQLRDLIPQLQAIAAKVSNEEVSMQFTNFIGAYSNFVDLYVVYLDKPTQKHGDAFASAQSGMASTLTDLSAACTTD